jgi:hypothetical protein
MTTTRFARTRFVISAAVTLIATAALGSAVVMTQTPPTAPLPQPTFHHLHLNSTDPAAAIAGYLALWPGSTERSTLAGFDAVKNGKVYLLFNKVATPAPREPQSAYWHQVWLTPNVREYVARARAIKMEPEPLYTSDEGAHVDISSDTFAGSLTKSALADAKAKGAMPTHQAGFTFTHGPEGLSVEGFERAGETGRLAQIDMWQDDPVCAELWYEKHLGSTRRAPRGETAPPTETTCKVPPGEPSWPSTMKQGTRRTPSGRGAYGNVALFWYTRPGDRPLVSTRGQAVDHLAFAVADLDAWVAKLKRENVTFLREAYAFGRSRAVMVEGPSHEALELIEEK